MLTNIKNKNYKNKINKAILVTIIFLQAQGYLKAEFYNINKDNIEAARKDLQRSDINKNFILLSGSCFMTAGIGTFLWQYFRNTKDIEKRFDNIFEAYQNLTEEQKEKLDNAFNLPNKPKETFKENSIKFLKTGVPLLAFELGRSILLSKLGDLISNLLPNGFNWSDKMFANKTISWFIEHKTTLFDTSKAFNQSINNILIEEPDVELLEANYNMIVAQVEKILGFMLYNSNFLPKNAFAERNKALIIQKRTVAILLELLAKIKDYIQLIKDNQELSDDSKRISTYENLKSTFLKLIENIESFKEIDKAINLEDKVKRNIFTEIIKLFDNEKQGNLDQELDIAELENLFKDMLNK